MNRSISNEPDDRAARAFARVGYKTMVAKLYGYATCVLRLAAIDAARAGRVEALDLVHTLVVNILSGTVVWVLPEHATDEEIVGYACTKLYGMLSNLRKHDARTSGGDALDQLADGAPDPLATLLTRHSIAELLRAVGDDAEATAHLRGVLEGKPRAQIAAQLGCSVEHATALRKRIMRGVAALNASMNDNGEDEPPSSGPRGHDDELPTAEERHRAPPEPPRGALRAGRRR
jgi:DNA-directed RNA polymerase specialized sigma24 family protein